MPEIGRVRNKIQSGELLFQKLKKVKKEKEKLKRRGAWSSFGDFMWPLSEEGAKLEKIP